MIGGMQDNAQGLPVLHCSQANDFAGHNSSLFVLGVMILWFGWCVPYLVPVG